MRRMLIIALAVSMAGASLFTGPKAHAAGSVTVVLTTTGANGDAETAAACELDVPQGADGVALFDAAVADGCIDSYRTQTHPQFGTLVTCVDGVCDGADAFGVNCLFWVWFENGTFPPYGVDGYTADDGDVVSWVLEPFGSPALGFC